jgi:hemolysin activation/secretion protein
MSSVQQVRREAVFFWVCFIVPLLGISIPQISYADGSTDAGYHKTSQSQSSLTLEPDVGTAKTHSVVPSFTVHRIKILGSKVFSAEDLKPFTQSLVVQSISLSSLNEVANAITQLYVKRGFTTSQAIVPKQTIQDGAVTIQVIEGWLGEIRVEGNHKLNADYIRSRLRMKAETPLNLVQLETKIRLLNTDPQFDSVEASLRAGTRPGESILIVKVKEAASFSSTVSTDNYSSSSMTSPMRYQVTNRNLMGRGDELSLSTLLDVSPSNISQDLLKNYDVAYRLPINAGDGTIQLHASYGDGQIADRDFASLGLRNHSEVYAFKYRQPLIHTLQSELAVSVGVTVQKSQTFLFGNIPFSFGLGADDNGITQTRILQLGQEYRRSDDKGSWAVQSSLNLGLGILGATEHSDPSTPDGRFVNWQLQGQRGQRLGNNNLLIAQGELQLSPNNLLPSEQFDLGGGQSIRGFRPNARSGDNGWRLSLEGRFPVLATAQKRPILQLAPFIEAGGVWSFSQYSTLQTSQNTLAGAGLGVIWQPSSSLSVRLDYGIPLVNLREQNNGFQDSGIYFSVVSSHE